MQGNIEINQALVNGKPAPLAHLIARLQQEQEAKRDFKVPSAQLRVSVPPVLEADPEQEHADRARELQFRLGSGPTMEMSTWAHGQLSDRLGIPRKYYQRLQQDHPLLLATNIDILDRREPQDFLVRTMNGRIRAVLSSKFKALDHLLALGGIADALRAHHTAHPEAWVTARALAVTDQRMIVQATFEHLTRTITVQNPNYRGERERVLTPGFSFSNSEIGAGRFLLEESLRNQWCSNMAIVEQRVARAHIGGRLTTGDDGQVAEYYGDDTLEAEAKALALRMRDEIGAICDPERFERRCRLMEAASHGDRLVTVSLEDFPERLTKVVDVTQDLASKVLSRMAQDGDFSLFGVHSAMTREAQEVDPDTAIDLERKSWSVLNMTASDFNQAFAA